MVLDLAIGKGVLTVKQHMVLSSPYLLNVGQVIQPFGPAFPHQTMEDVLRIHVRMIKISNYMSIGYCGKYYYSDQK